MATAIWFQDVADASTVESAFETGTLAGVDVTGCEIYIDDTDVVILGTSSDHTGHSWIDGNVVCALTADDGSILIPTLIDLGAAWLAHL